MALEYVSAGTAVTDQAIAITTACTVNGTGLFMGRTNGLAAATVIGTASTSYGVWSAAGKTGTRYRALAAGLPGSTAELVWDIQSGRIYSTVSRATVYARFWKHADLMNEGRALNVFIPSTLTGTAADLFVQPSPWNWKVGEYAISVLGNRPTGTLNVTLRSAAAGGGSGMTMTLGSGEATCSAGFKALPRGGLSLNTTDYIVARGAGQGFSFINISLREKME